MSRSFSVSKYSPAGRAPSWKVEGRSPDGAKVRRFFKTKAEAETFAADANTEVRATGWQAMGLSDEARVEAAKCLESLAPTGRTLTEAVAFYLKHLAETERSVSVKEAVAELLERKRAEGMSNRHILDLKSRLTTFAETFGRKTVATINAKELDAWLVKLGVAPQTRLNYRRVVAGLFAYAIESGWAKENPMLKTALPKVPSKPPGILTPVAMRALVALAAEHHPDILPAVLIQAFAGLRTQETLRLNWREVRLDRGHIEVSAKNSKTAQRRLVAIRPNLTAFLAPVRRESGPVCPSCFSKCVADLRRLMKKAGHSFPDNALRHSFASYHLADCEDAGKTAHQLGHKGTAVLFEHYRELVTPEDAAAFWGIMPGDAAGGNVIALPAPVAAPVDKRRKAAKAHA